MSGVEEISPVVEEYLECVYRLEEKMGVARTSDMVKSLGVVPGTVTNTVEWMERKDLVTHKPYKGVKLTKKGRKIALQVVRRHRLSERLLTDILHMEWGKVHDEACKLEHSMTEEVIAPLEEALNYPKTCPHGNPIPTKSGGVVEEKTRPLSELKTGEESCIVKITEEKSDLLRYLGELGLVPGVPVKILKKAPLEGPITVGVGSANHALSPAIASIIKVRARK
jgi:DtxR family Mn-dependent transcriptional regulator